MQFLRCGFLSISLGLLVFLAGLSASASFDDCQCQSSLTGFDIKCEFADLLALNETVLQEAGYSKSLENLDFFVELNRKHIRGCSACFAGESPPECQDRTEISSSLVERYHSRYKHYIAEAAEQFGVPVALLTCLLWQESEFHNNPNERKPARGLGQLQRGAWRDIARRLNNKSTPWQNEFKKGRYRDVKDALKATDLKCIQKSAKEQDCFSKLSPELQNSLIDRLMKDPKRYQITYEYSPTQGEGAKERKKGLQSLSQSQQKKAYEHLKQWQADLEFNIQSYEMTTSWNDYIDNVSMRFDDISPKKSKPSSSLYYSQVFQEHINIGVSAAYLRFQIDEASKVIGEMGGTTDGKNAFENSIRLVAATYNAGWGSVKRLLPKLEAAGFDNGEKWTEILQTAKRRTGREWEVKDYMESILRCVRPDDFRPKSSSRNDNTAFVKAMEKREKRCLRELSAR